jgi:hypothetical protein
MVKKSIVKYDLIGKRFSELTFEEYSYFASLSLEKRREIVLDNYLLAYKDTLYANQIIMDRSNKKRKIK